MPPVARLVVDDDEIICKLGTTILQSQGYEVLCANNGFEGLSALKQSLSEVIISDLQMPKMNGFEFLSVVRKRFPQIPIIAISGEFSGRNVPESVLADAFFQKGQYSPAELFEKILPSLSKCLSALARDGLRRPPSGCQPWQIKANSPSPAPTAYEPSR